MTLKIIDVSINRPRFSLILNNEAPILLNKFNTNTIPYFNVFFDVFQIPLKFKYCSQIIWTVAIKLAVIFKSIVASISHSPIEHDILTEEVYESNFFLQSTPGCGIKSTFCSMLEMNKCSQEQMVFITQINYLLFIYFFKKVKIEAN